MLERVLNSFERTIRYFSPLLAREDPLVNVEANAEEICMAMVLVGHSARNRRHSENRDMCTWLLYFLFTCRVMSV